MIAPPRDGQRIPPIPRVQIQGLDYSFGSGDSSELVLRNINLSVKPGTLVVLTGPSGCGKTTLLTLIGALRLGPGGKRSSAGQGVERPRQ